jgi:hypothetical protein
VRRWVIAGTLDPLRDLFNLVGLYLDGNSIGGMSVPEAVAKCRC